MVKKMSTDYNYLKNFINQEADGLYAQALQGDNPDIVKTNAKLLDEDNMLTQQEILSFFNLLGYYKDRAAEKSILIIDILKLNGLIQLDNKSLAADAKKKLENDAEEIKTQITNSKEKIIFCVINKWEVHWSLLFKYQDQGWYYLDSSREKPYGLNYETMMFIKKRVLDTTDVTNLSNPSDGPGTPIQKGVYECGTFVLLYMLAVISCDLDDIQKNAYDKGDTKSVFDDDNRKKVVESIKKFYANEYQNQRKQIENATIEKLTGRLSDIYNNVLQLVDRKNNEKSNEFDTTITNLHKEYYNIKKFIYNEFNTIHALSIDEYMSKLNK